MVMLPELVLTSTRWPPLRTLPRISRLVTVPVIVIGWLVEMLPEWVRA